MKFQITWTIKRTAEIEAENRRNVDLVFQAMIPETDGTLIESSPKLLSVNEVPKIEE